MRNLFVDANIIIDFLALREPFSTYAAELFELAEKSRVKIFVSAVSFNVVYYVLRQKYGHLKTLEFLREFFSLVTILSVSQEVIKNSLESSNSDFEDAIQYFCALTNPEIDVIVSRDKKGFKKSKLPVFTPGELVQLLLAN